MLGVSVDARCRIGEINTPSKPVKFCESLRKRSLGICKGQANRVYKKKLLCITHLKYVYSTSNISHVIGAEEGNN